MSTIHSTTPETNEGHQRRRGNVNNLIAQPAPMLQCLIKP